MSAANVVTPPHAKFNFSALAWYCEYVELVKALWAILGRPWTNLKDEAEWSNKTIPGGQHGELKIQLTQDQRDAIMPLLTKMQLFQGCFLKPGKYFELEVTGAKFNGMVERWILVLERLADQDPRRKVSFEQIIFQVGHRPRQDVDKEGRLFDGSVERIFAGLSGKIKDHQWVKNQMKLMDEPDPTAEWNGAFATEYLLGILALIVATDGGAEVQDGTHPSFVDDETLPGIPPRTAPWCRVILPNGTPVIVLNGPAVERRRGGAPRPTTTSNTAYRLKHFPPLGDTIAAVSGKVHWYRVIGDFERQVRGQFPGVTIYGFSRGANSGEQKNLFNNAVGEVVNLLQKAQLEYEAING